MWLNILQKVSTGHIIGEEQEVTNPIPWFLCLQEEFKVTVGFTHGIVRNGVGVDKL